MRLCLKTQPQRLRQPCVWRRNLCVRHTRSMSDTGYVPDTALGYVSDTARVVSKHSLGCVWHSLGCAKTQLTQFKAVSKHSPKTVDCVDTTVSTQPKAVTNLWQTQPKAVTNTAQSLCQAQQKLYRHIFRASSLGFFGGFWGFVWGGESGWGVWVFSGVFGDLFEVGSPSPGNVLELFLHLWVVFWGFMYFIFGTFG